MAREVKVPDIGDFEAVDVVEVLVKEGDTIAVDQGLVTLESDKASMEVPSSAAGTVETVKVKVGDKVAAGDVLVVLAGEEEAAEEPEAEEAEEEPPEEPKAEEEPAEEPEEVEEAEAEDDGGGDVEVAVPDMGGFDAVDVIEVLVKAGDTIEVEQPLVTLESDKASMEVPSSAAGKVAEVKVKVGDKVSAGDVLVVLAGGSRQAAPLHPEKGGGKPKPPEKKAPEKKAPAAEKPPDVGAELASARSAPTADATDEPRRLGEPIDDDALDRAYASPSVRRLARDLGVDLGRVEGSGRKGRITPDDVHAYVRRALAGRAPAAAGAGGGVAGFEWPAMPAVDFAKFGDVEVVEMSRIRRVAARNLHRSWLHVPHVTQHEDADVTELERFRREAGAELEKKHGVKLTPLAFLLRASAAALREHPMVNASLDPSGEKLVLKKYFHVGVAVDTENGLVVPVIRDVDTKGLVQLANEVVEAAKRAREGKLTPKDFQGACFTITSLGGIGGTSFTPIVNAPEVAILGVSRNVVRPVWNEAAGTFEPRTMMPLSLSYDHRVVDGALGCRFVVTVARYLGDVRRLLL